MNLLIMFYTFDLSQGFHCICPSCWACPSGRFHLWTVRSGWDKFILLCSDSTTDLVRIAASSRGHSGIEGRRGGCRRVGVYVQQEGHNPREAPLCCSPEGSFISYGSHATRRTRVWQRPFQDYGSGRGYSCASFPAVKKLVRDIFF